MVIAAQAETEPGLQAVWHFSPDLDRVSRETISNFFMRNNSAQTMSAFLGFSRHLSTFIDESRQGRTENVETLSGICLAARQNYPAAIYFCRTIALQKVQNLSGGPMHEIMLTETG